jgi:hypothetical protein
MATEVAEVEVPSDCGELYCPACGRLIVDGKEKKRRNCKHLVFAYLDIVQEFTYVAPAYKTVAKAARKAYEADDDVDQIRYVLDRIDARKQASILCFAATSSGMCCGPCSSTLCVAIDFDPEGDEDVKGKG